MAFRVLLAVFLACTVTPIAALPGPSDISNTYTTPNPLLQTLQHLRRQFTGGALVGFTGPPADRCFHRNDKLVACPYGGQCRPDQGYTCETYCTNYGKDLDEKMSCNLPCSYPATGLKGELPKNPLHCANPSDRSPLKCESNWACYRQFSAKGPAFEQQPPVCSPVYELCQLPALIGNDSAAESGSTTPAPLVSLSLPSGPMMMDDDESMNVNGTSADNSTVIARRQTVPIASASCSAGLTCVEDPRPALGLPPNKAARIGICIPSESRCDHMKWNTCGEKGHCARDPAAAREDMSAPGYCVRVLGDEWTSSNSTGLGKRNVLRKRC